jgi:hypothetical protein
MMECDICKKGIGLEVCLGGKIEEYEEGRDIDTGKVLYRHTRCRDKRRIKRLMERMDKLEGRVAELEMSSMNKQVMKCEICHHDIKPDKDEKYWTFPKGKKNEYVHISCAETGKRPEEIGRDDDTHEKKEQV